MASVEQDRAKRFKVYKNGDLNFYGKDVVLNKRRIRTWDAFLQSVTLDLKTNDAVRSIRTPTHGSLVKSLDDLHDNRQYVAVGNGRFKRAQYLNLHDDRPKPVINSPRYVEPVPVLPVSHNRRLQVSGRIRKIPTDVLTIFVYANGRDLDRARRLTISHKMMLKWDNILEHIDEKVPGMAGACRKVYTTEGQQITSPTDLQPNNFYVAVAAEIGGFKRLQYGRPAPSFNNSPKRERNGSNHSQDTRSTPSNSTPRRLDPLPPRNRKQRKSYNSEPPLNGSNDHSVSSNSDRVTKSEGQSPARKTRYRDRSNQNRPAKKDDGVFHAKPVKHRRSRDETKQVDLDKDEGGVFKAKGKNRETKGAEEVEETKDTHVDLPIDQVEAEEVKDEEIEDDSPQKSPTPRKASTPKRKTPSPKRKTPSPMNEQQKKDEQEAAMRIQAGYRGHLTRKQIQDKKESEPEEEEKPAPAPVDSKTRTPSPAGEKEERIPTPQNEEEERIPTPQNEAEGDDDEQKKAAAKIQAGYRGMKTRKDMKSKKEEEVKQQDEAALKIQAGYRGYQGRKKVHQIQDQKEKEQAATRIQAGYRGYNTRKEMKSKKEEQRESQRKLALAEKKEESSKAASPIPSPVEEQPPASPAQEKAPSPAPEQAPSPSQDKAPSPTPEQAASPSQDDAQVPAQEEETPAQASEEAEAPTQQDEEDKTSEQHEEEDKETPTEESQPEPAMEQPAEVTEEDNSKQEDESEKDDGPDTSDPVDESPESTDQSGSQPTEEDTTDDDDGPTNVEPDGPETTL